MTKKEFKITLKKSLSLLLSLIFLLGHISLFAGAEHKAVLSAADKTKPVVPEHVHELSRLIKSRLDENDFASIELEIGNPEMVIDGRVQPISADENVVPVIENGELAIPEAVIAAVSDIPEVQGNCDDEEDINRKITESELEALGYDVEYNEGTKKIFITEPFQLMRLLVKTETGRVDNTYGAVETINISNNITVLQYDSKEKTKSAYEHFNNDTEILICVQDQLVNIGDCEQGEVKTVSVQGEEESPYKSWGTVRVGADQYMERLPDASELEEVVVAIIDTGVDLDHPFFEGRIKEGGWDFFDDDDDPDDEHFHGTHCAGIVRDATKENVKILPIKIGDAEGNLVISTLFDAINYAVDSGADILSMSFGYNILDISWTQLFSDTIKNAYDKGVISVAGAGNWGSDLADLKPPTLPATLEQVITVSSCNDKNDSSDFSNYGDSVDICAPGENILSSVPGGGFEVYSGTSMSTPLVAAGAALVKSNHPDMTNDEVKNWLYNNSIDMGTMGWDKYYGYGILFMGEDDRDFYRPVESVSFNEESFELDWGENRTLYLEFQPRVPTDYLETVLFASSDEEIVYLQEIRGRRPYIVITGLKAGTAVITATYLGTGEITASVTVTVRPKKEIVSMGIDHFVMYDGTVYFLNANGDGLTPLRSDDNRLFADVKKCSTYYLIRSDGTLWARRLKNENGGKELTYPIQVTDTDNLPLSDIVDVSGTTALRSDGTVWIRAKNVVDFHDHEFYEDDDLIFTPLLKEDGTPLTGIKKITSYTAITEDGYAYYFDHFYNCAKYITFDDGTPFSDIAEAYYFYYVDFLETYTVVLTNDGTVWVKGSNRNNLLGTPDVKLRSERFIPVKISSNQYLTDVKQIYYHDTDCYGTNFTTYALCNDGSLWAWGGVYEYNAATLINKKGFLGIGEYDNSKIYASQVKTDENTHLENVSEILGAGTCTMRCALKDGSVWQTGRINTYDYETETYTEYILYAEPMKYAGKTIMLYSDKYDRTPKLNLPEESEIVVDENRCSIYGIPVGMRVDDFEAMFNVTWDGYVEIAAVGRFVGTGSLLIVHDSHGEVVAEYSAVIFGDLDGNGRITAADISLAKQGYNDGFEDKIFEFAANIVKTSKRDSFTLADISALKSAVSGEPIDQAAMAEMYMYTGW